MRGVVRRLRKWGDFRAEPAAVRGSPRVLQRHPSPFLALATHPPTLQVSRPHRLPVGVERRPEREDRGLQCESPTQILQSSWCAGALSRQTHCCSRNTFQWDNQYQLLLRTRIFLPEIVQQCCGTVFCMFAAIILQKWGLLRSHHSQLLRDLPHLHLPPKAHLRATKQGTGICQRISLSRTSIQRNLPEH